MKSISLGLRGKFVAALLIAAILPLVVGLVLLGTVGFRLLLDERAKLHRMEASSLLAGLDQASHAQGGQFLSWIAADTTLLEYVDEMNRSLAGKSAETIAAETLELDRLWPSLTSDDPLVEEILANPAAVNLRQYTVFHPEVAEIILTDATGRLIAATGKSTDVDQADESWWQNCKDFPPGSACTEALQYDTSSDVFSLDVVVPLHEHDRFIGIAKLAVDVTSLFAQLDLAQHGNAGGRWEIILPDGIVLTSSDKSRVAMREKVSPAVLQALKAENSGWASVKDRDGIERIIGYCALGMADGIADSYAVFSSPRETVVAPLRRNLWWMGIIGGLLVVLCGLGGFLFIHVRILQPLASLGKAARSISATARLRDFDSGDDQEIQETRQQAEADLVKIQAIHTSDEVEDLAGDLAVMTSRVLRYHREMEEEVAAKTAVIHEDLEMAREFQNALMPQSYPEVPPADVANALRLKFAHFYQPASTVGGDFFDLIELDEHRAGILIADVMGHGARSALVTAILRALVRNHAGSDVEPGVFLSDLNHHLGELISRSGQSLFVTAFFLILDTRDGKASWAVAGHPAPLRVRRGSGKDPAPMWDVPPHQPALGLMSGFAYESFSSPLRSGDIFLLYTDGAVEAENPVGEAFGVGRLVKSFDQALDGPMAAMPAKIVCDVTAFQKHRRYEDDVCLLAIEAGDGG